MSLKTLFLFILNLGISQYLFAQEVQKPESHFGAIVGSSLLLGNMGNSSHNAPQRLMSAFSLESLLGYRMNDWIIGLDLDLRSAGQLTAIDKAGNTNWKGSGWLVGLGASRVITPQISVQAAIDFLGKYSFAKQTSTTENDYIGNPMILRFKGQYFYWPQIPLSIDCDLHYLMYRQLTISSTQYNENSTGFYAGLGLSWHFGSQTQVSQPEAVVAPKPEIVTSSEIPSVVQTQQQELSQFVDVVKTERGLMIILKGDMSFATGTAQLSEQAQKIISKAAAILIKAPKQTLRVEGHTDSAGKKTKNQILSQARAESVQAELVKNGFKADQIKTQGFGQERPVASNKTKKGRAQNRRVEIFIEQ